MKNPFIYSILLAVVVIVAMVFLPSANVEKARPNRYESTTIDTLVESESATFTIPDIIRNQVGFFFQVTVVQDSFATDAIAIVKESAWDTENRWSNKDTLTISAAGTYAIEGTTNAARLMLEIQTDTTNQQGRYWTAATLVETF